jgi:SAM-dependent methyltransferase
MIDIEGILRDTAKPDLFAPAGQPIWTDEHVSKQLLIAHLDPNTDAASRRPAMIDRSVAWFVDLLKLRLGTSIIDLGCGPGLYSQRLAKLGMQVTGIDFSQESIAYARSQALIEKLQIDYRLQNYLELDEPGAFEVALLIYGDYCVLRPSDRKRAAKQRAAGTEARREVHSRCDYPFVPTEVRSQKRMACWQEWILERKAIHCARTGI